MCTAQPEYSVLKESATLFRTKYEITVGIVLDTWALLLSRGGFCVDSVDYANKTSFNRISVIRLLGLVTKVDFKWAVETAIKKKKLDCFSAEFLTIDKGLCVQIMCEFPVIAAAQVDFRK